jgi:hypothetical protein
MKINYLNFESFQAIMFLEVQTMLADFRDGSASLLLSQDLFPIAGIIIPAIGVDLCAVGGGVFTLVRGVGIVGEVTEKGKTRVARSTTV